MNITIINMIGIAKLNGIPNNKFNAITAPKISYISAAIIANSTFIHMSNFISFG